MSRKLDFSTVVMVLVFVGAVCLQIVRSFHWGHDDWGVTEWLINYAGGFVRRGLPGTMIYWLALRTGIQANNIAIFFSVVTFVFVLAFFLIRTRRVFPVALILSPVLLGAPAYQNFIVRKDFWGILLLIVCLTISEAKWKERTRLFLINLIAVIAILSHETFFFFGLPILILLNIKPVAGGAAVVQQAKDADACYPQVLAVSFCVCDDSSLPWECDGCECY